jgi:arylsulfatase A-like enzyme
VRRNPRLGFGKIDYLDRREQQRLEALRSVDDGVGQIVQRLADRGVLGNTYLVFISDNGFFGGEHRFDSAKFLPYEPSNHMPLVIRGPGILPASHSGELVANIDLAPTILELSGTQPTTDIDGRSLIRFWQDPLKRSQRPILLEGFTGTGELGTPLRASSSAAASPRDYEGVRIGRYKFIRYRSGAKELYDLKTDPYELHSRHADPRYIQARRWLEKVLQRMKLCRGQSCRKPQRGKIPLPRPR